EGRRSSFPSACRTSMTILFPSTYPSSRRPCRNASMRAGLVEGEVAFRYPILGIFVGCCASAEETVTSKTIVSNKNGNLLFNAFPRLIFASALSDHAIRPRQHIRRYR